MIQDTTSSRTAPLAQEDELEFEPRLSADCAGLPENQADSEEDGEQVRDEELIMGNEDFVDEAPRRAVPPPLVPPPLSRKPVQFQSVPPPSSPFPTFASRPPESPISRERFAEPVTSVHRVTQASRSSDFYRRDVEQSPAPSERLNRDTINDINDGPRLTQDSNSRRSRELADYARPSNSDRPLLERRRPQRKEILREGDLLLGKLRIERVVSEGLLVTAEAVHLGLGTRAQVLLLSPHGRGFTDAQEHFVRMGRTVAQLQSEHVARVIEIGTLESGAPFLVTEMQGFSDLGEVIRVRGPLAVSDAVDYAIQVAEAFAEAHSLGTIHGNLRPSSLRVSEGMDGWPLIKVLGFGAMAQWSLSSASVRTAGHRGAAASSALPYLSPEQIRSPGDLDTRTDLWSLGAVLHEMLVGYPMYQADNTAALLAMIAADPPPPITALRADVPRQLESVILRCLQKDRANRFATVAELARALQPYAPPECQPMVDRIVRVMARGSGVPSTYSRPHNAMVHIRSHNATARSFESRAAAPPRSPPVARFGFIVGAVVLLGSAAGVTGAVFASQMLRPARSEGQVQEAVKPPANAIRETPSVAASPIQDNTPANIVSPVTSVAVAAAPNPAPSAVASPAALREAPRPAIAVQRRQSVMVTTNPAPHKEARVDKAESSPATKAADLFGDIK